MVEMSTEAEGERLISKYIRPGEKHPLSEATIGRSGPSVWRIIRFFQASGNPDQVLEYFGFLEPTLEAALAYYDRFKPFIDAKILLEADIPEERPSSVSNIPGHITGLGSR